jgi:hypothetical protein
VSQSKLAGVYQWAQIVIAVGTLVGGASLLYKWASTPSRDVTAYIHTYEFSLPYAAEVAAALGSEQTAEARLLRSLSNARYLYRIDIQNVSQQAIRNVNVELEGGIAHTTARNRFSAPVSANVLEASRGDRLDISLLRPEERVTVYIWARNIIFNTRSDASKLLVTWENGSAEKIFMEYSGPFYRWLDANMTWLVPFIFVPVIFLSLVFLIAAGDALYKKARSRSAEVAVPPENALPPSEAPVSPPVASAARPNDV